MRTPFITLAAVAALMLPTFPVMAFDPSGTMASIFIILGLGSFTLLNMVLQGLFYFTGPYSRRDFARIHAGISILMPLAAMVLAVKDNAGTADMILKLGAILIASGFALMPLLLKSSAKQPTPNSGLWIALGAFALMLPGMIIPVIGIVAAAVAAVALNYAQDLKARLVAVIALIPSISMFLYWTVQKVSLLVAGGA
ncbi:hypothetical protein L2725_05320 [Shewanella corallii]|uniref:Uncharacterized protein n=1 Tax=Shewanella corallii TaxID=560080 RepID=A0ABT0N445_9GAMM|nr:hypothetical protein [Shewanella corallii]MCL2913204.1 hypothetical protein [Shewanella corallii]